MASLTIVTIKLSFTIVYKKVYQRVKQKEITETSTFSKQNISESTADNDEESKIEKT